MLTPGAASVELADGGGNDTVELSGISPADVSLRWSSDGMDLAVLVDDVIRLTVLDAGSGGAVENISINGSNYGLAALPQAINNAPVPSQYQSKVEGSFFGGYVGDGSASDLDGDRLSYKLETVSGEFAEAMWRVDPSSGAVLGDFTRTAREGSAYSYVTISASDGIEKMISTLTIWWTNRNEEPMPDGAKPRSASDDEQMAQLAFIRHVETAPLGGDAGPFYV